LFSEQLKTTRIGEDEWEGGSILQSTWVVCCSLSSPLRWQITRRGKSQPGRGQTKKKIKAPEEEAFLELYLFVFKNGKSPESRTWELFVCSVTGRSMVEYEKKRKKNTFAA
jgi:hypothetical protein